MVDQDASTLGMHCFPSGRMTSTWEHFLGIGNFDPRNRFCLRKQARSWHRTWNALPRWEASMQRDDLVAWRSWSEFPHMASVSAHVAAFQGDRPSGTYLHRWHRSARERFACQEYSWMEITCVHFSPWSHPLSLPTVHSCFENSIRHCPTAKLANSIQ